MTPLTGDALRNAERLKTYHDHNGTRWISADCTPMTDVTDIVRLKLERLP